MELQVEPSTGLRCTLGWGGSRVDSWDELGATTAGVPMKTGVVEVMPGMVRFMHVTFGKEPVGAEEN